EERRLPGAWKPHDPDLERHYGTACGAASGSEARPRIRVKRPVDTPEVKTNGLSVLADLLLQRDERAVLQGLDRALRLPEDRRYFAVRQVEHELQRKHLLLLLGQVLDQLEHALPPDRLERGELGGRFGLAGRLGHLLFGLPAP